MTLEEKYNDGPNCPKCGTQMKLNEKSEKYVWWFCEKDKLITGSKVKEIGEI